MTEKIAKQAAKKFGKIAVFDSGMGGVSFLVTARQLLPHEDFIYYGDLANAPYGEKSAEFICSRMTEIFDFFLEQQAKIIVIACNTATSAAVKYLRSHYAGLTILGMEPAIKPAAVSGEEKILLLSTPVTACGGNTLHLIAENSRRSEIINIPCRGLMDLVENNEHLPEAENEARLTAYLKAKLDAHLADGRECGLILGCTHYIFLWKLLGELYPGLRLYDGNEGTARNLRNHLETKNLLNPGIEPGSITFYSSVDNKKFAAKAAEFMKKLK